MRQLIAIALLLPLSGCLEQRDSFYVPTDIAPLFGGGAAAPARPMPVQPAPGSQAPGTGAAKMLEDPEASESSTSEYVYAFTEQEARSLCQKTADRRGWRLDRVTPETFVNNLGKRKFSCFWTIFGEPNYDNDAHR